MSEYQPATFLSRCPRCGSEINQHRHYPANAIQPVAANHYYCPPCDEEWWIDAPPSSSASDTRPATEEGNA